MAESASGVPGALKSSQTAIDLIVDFEVTSEEAYTRLYQAPTWPGGESGVTIGIGYDCGYATREEIIADWGDKLSQSMIHALCKVVGVTGSPAHAAAHELHDSVLVPWGAAMGVFLSRDMPKWEAEVARAVPHTEDLSGDSFGALVSLAYNRGAAGFNSRGSRFTEMWAIRQLMALRHYALVPQEFRAMKRLWPNVAGLRRRRDAEADLFAKGCAQGAVKEGD